MAAPKIFTGVVGWRRILVVTTTVGVLVGLAAVGMAALISGGAAAASAGGAAGVVIGLSFLSLALIDWADRRVPRLAIPLYMVGFCLKLAAVAVLLPLIGPVEWIQPGWALGAGLAVFLLWQAALIRGFAVMRVPAYSPPES